MSAFEKELREIFADNEVKFLIERLKQIKAEGFGRLVVQFKNGHPDILERRIAEKFPSPSKTYQSE